MKAKGKFEKYINFSIFSNIVIFNSLADCCGGNDKKGKGCCSYGQNKDNNEITRDDDDKEKEEEDNGKEEQLKQQQAELENKKNDIKSLLKEVIDSNSQLPEKDRVEIKTKNKDIDDCDDIESLNNIFKELNGIKTQIFNKANEVNNKELAEQIIVNKRNNVIKIFDEVDDLIKKMGEIIDNNFRIEITKDEIQKENGIKELNKIESDLNKQKLELIELYKKLTTDTPICETEYDFIEKFNERKNILADRFNDPVKNNLKSNNLDSTNIDDDYFVMYQDMTKDIFSHEIALDLQIYRYILKLEGFIEALDNIIKRDRIQYDFFTEYSNFNGGYNAEIFKKKDNYYLDYYSKIDIKNYEKFKDIYSGIFYIKDKFFKYVPFKYVRCEKDKCDYDKKEEYCISCKLRNLLEKENIGDLYKKIYKEYGGSSDAGGTVRTFIYNHINSKYKKTEKFLNPSFYKDYELEKNRDEKKVLMIEWALTIEFMKRFIPEFTGKNKFYLYRTMGFSSNDNYIPTNKLLSQAVDSTSLFGPCYFGMHKNIIICLHKIEAKLYCCFFNHIINPFSKGERYASNVKKEFLNCKLKVDYECEIGYIPVNQKYKEEVKCEASKPGEIGKIQNYIYERTIENFKQNMLNKGIETTKLHVFKGNEIININ